MDKWLIFTLGLFALTVSSCGAPKAISDAAIATFENDMMCNPNVDIYWGGECREFKVSNAARKTLTDADRANGIDAAWCLQIDYIWRSDNGGEWKQSTKIFYVTQSGDNYMAVAPLFWYDVDDCLSMADRLR